MADRVASAVGVVVIGRNEGERLRTCLSALLRASIVAEQIVYVDSGSSDGSVELAGSFGINAIALTAPFTAAKGRNAGMAWLLEQHPALLAIQFVDGDCEYFPSWFAIAARSLHDDSSVAAVTGILTERHPEASIYNLLCDVEWTGVVGEIDTFGGNVMIRCAALSATGTYNPELIAGEDPEFAVRIKKVTGQRIVRIDEPMCLHDAAMTKASQWWKRNVRSGHAYAQVSRLHGEAPLRFWKRETRSNWLWGAALPLAMPVLAPPAYVVLFWRIYGDARRRGLSAEAARASAFFTAVGKIPQAVGQATFWWNRLRGEPSAIIEYKKPAS